MHLQLAVKSLWLLGLLLPAIAVAEDTQYFVTLKHVDPKDKPYFDRNGFHVGITRPATPKGSMGEDDDEDNDDGAAAKPKAPIFDLAVGIALPEVANKQIQLSKGQIRTFSFVKRRVGGVQQKYFLRPTHADKLPGPGQTSKQVRLGLKYRPVPGWSEGNWGHQQDMLSIEYKPSSEDDNLFEHPLGPDRVLFMSPKDYQERARACVMVDEYQYIPPGSMDFSPQSAPLGKTNFQQSSGSSPVHLSSPSNQQHNPHFQHSGSAPIAADEIGDSQQVPSHETLSQEPLDPLEQDMKYDGEDVYILIAQKNGNVYQPNLWSCRRVKLVLEPIPKDWLKAKTGAEKAPLKQDTMTEITLIKEVDEDEQTSMNVPSSLSKSISKQGSESSNSLSKHASESGSGDSKKGRQFGDD